MDVWTDSVIIGDGFGSRHATAGTGRPSDSRVNFYFLVEISLAEEPSREEALLGALLEDEMASLLKEKL